MPVDVLETVLRTNPALVNWAFAVYLAGAFVSHVIRVAYPDEAKRSGTVRLIAAISDACMLTFLTGAKALGRKLGN